MAALWTLYTLVSGRSSIGTFTDAIIPTPADINIIMLDLERTMCLTLVSSKLIALIIWKKYYLYVTKISTLYLFIKVTAREYT